VPAEAHSSELVSIAPEAAAPHPRDLEPEEGRCGRRLAREVQAADDAVGVERGVLEVDDARRLHHGGQFRMTSISEREFTMLRLGRR
jgi:hypothetical protein